MRTALLALTTVLLAGCAATDAEIAQAEDRAANDQARLARALAGRVPEQPQSCLSSVDRRQSSATRYYGSTVVYRFGDRLVRNDMNGNCSFRGDPILVTRTPTGQLCSGEIVQLIDRTSRFPMGSCAFGDFVTYRRPPR